MTSTNVSLLAQMEAAQQEIEALEKRHQQELSPLRETLRRREMDFVREFWGVRIGALVRSRKKVYRVTRFRSEYLSEHSQPWLYGVWQLKDGTFGTKEHSIYDDWKVVTP